jgi:hypothetical protein
MKKSLVITSIANDQHPVLQLYAKKCKEINMPFICIGDTKSPAEFKLDGCDFWSVERQLSLDFKFAKICPTRHYARKNIGYLIAIQQGFEELVETDDDNLPKDEFWEFKNNRHISAYDVKETGWINIYKYFSNNFIWPRGLPLQELQKTHPSLENYSKITIDCPIQQGLADENPDVDAVYRLTYPLPLNFDFEHNIALGKNAWSPFNSQNTQWYKDAFPLLYLPAYCSFRMTDIWRSFVAQRIAWENDWSILYHKATVWQERNEHNLLKDFEDEIPGYLNNHKIANDLDNLSLKGGKDNLLNDLILCYDMLTKNGYVGKEEMELVHAWSDDLNKLM